MQHGLRPRRRRVDVKPDADAGVRLHQQLPMGRLLHRRLRHLLLLLLAWLLLLQLLLELLLTLTPCRWLYLLRWHTLARQYPLSCRCALCRHAVCW